MRALMGNLVFFLFGLSRLFANLKKLVNAAIQRLVRPHISPCP